MSYGCHYVQVFELNPVRAWGAVLTSIVSMAASLYLISISPWYLLPLAWALSGTAFTGVSASLRYTLFGITCGFTIVCLQCCCFASATTCPRTYFVEGSRHSVATVAW